MTKSILIAGAGGNQIGIYEKARELGITTVAVDGNAGAVGFEYADHSKVANILDGRVLAEIATRCDVQGIYPAAELSVEAVAIATQELSLPGVSPEVATRVRNKAVMRRALDDAGIPNPAFHEVQNIDTATVAIEYLGFPCIIKPSDANSSKGVQQLNSYGELDEALALAIQYSFSNSALLEEYMPGEEFCVDGLIHDGRYIPGGITGKEVSPLPHRFDKGIFMPPQKSPAECEIIETCAREALEAIGYTNGTFHLEIIVSPDGPRIVEIAGRPGGGRIPTDLIPMAYGMDFMGDSIRIALGEAPISERRFERGVALYWFESQPGRIQDISNLRDAESSRGVKEIVFQAQVGDTLKPIIDCVTRDSVGYVLTEGNTSEEAVENVNRARSICKVITT